ncbi:MAG: hypothetical protein U5M53_13780 [Rhodoferax sp.]|nr:hypothetical protein [Rhodoferax sp.]
MNTKELAAKLRELGAQARYSTEPGRVVEQIASELADHQEDADLTAEDFNDRIIKLENDLRSAWAKLAELGAFAPQQV